MIKRISTINALDGSNLLIWFEGGEARLFNCKKTLDAASRSGREGGAPTANEARITADGYAVSWGDSLDLTSKELYDGGVAVDVSQTEQERLVAEVANARRQRGVSQLQLEGMSGVRQPVIARMETGASSPRLDTLIKVLAPLGKTLRVVDLDAALDSAC
jgi:DNA-binding XRE family transcriptional regulator